MKINSILKRAFILNPEPVACFLSMSVSIQQIAILSLGNFPKNLQFLLGSFLKGIFRPCGRMNHTYKNMGDKNESFKNSRHINLDVFSIAVGDGAGK